MKKRLNPNNSLLAMRLYRIALPAVDAEKTGVVFSMILSMNLWRKQGLQDGFVFGSPVYFAHPSGRLLTFMDRAFYSGGAAFQFKPAAAVLSARRAGTTASFDVINKYFTICSMPVVSSTYWNHVYGVRPEEVAEDKEGLMTMYNIGKNMAWLLKCVELGKENGLSASRQ